MLGWGMGTHMGLSSWVSGPWLCRGSVMGGDPRGGAIGDEGAKVDEGVIAANDEVHRVGKGASHGGSLQHTSSTSSPSLAWCYSPKIDCIPIF